MSSVNFSISCNNNKSTPQPSKGSGSLGISPLHIKKKLKPQVKKRGRKKTRVKIEELN